MTTSGLVHEFEQRICTLHQHVASYETRIMNVRPLQWPQLGWRPLTDVPVQLV